MADNAESSGDAQVTFKVKTSSDRNHTITMAESATVLELKTKLAGEDLENIPIERQRLIYSGRVMKNDDTLGSYKIKANNTIHMVKSAASNPTQQTSTTGPTPRAVPENISAGTNPNDPLAGLTGARYAGHQINLPGMEMFGPDGGMGPPMDEERIQRMMSDPNVQQSMNEALSNPDFVNMLIQSNPMLRNMPNAREMITSPFMRQMMTNPQMMSQAMRMQRNMRGGDSAFPAPGATDTTPDAAAGGNASTGDDASQQQAGMAFMLPNFEGAGGSNGGSDGSNIAQMIQRLLNENGLGDGIPVADASAISESTRGSETRDAQSTSQTGGVDGAQNTQNQTAANPFAALFPQGAQVGNDGFMRQPVAMTPEMMQRFMQMLGGGGALAPASSLDTRPPQEMYAEQLRQLNDMGFFDFDRNVAALRRSGGSVQGAVEQLLSAAD